MAKLKAHGIELDRREYTTSRVAVMSDGQIMRNYGSGWKLSKKLKKGVDPADYAKRIRAQYDARPTSFHAYIKALSDATSLENRYKLHTAIELMPDDPDGIWSTVIDDYGSLDVSVTEVAHLCRLYKNALGALGEEQTQAAA